MLYKNKNDTWKEKIPLQKQYFKLVKGYRLTSGQLQ